MSSNLLHIGARSTIIILSSCFLTEYFSPNILLLVWDFYLNIFTAQYRRFSTMNSHLKAILDEK